MPSAQYRRDRFRKGSSTYICRICGKLTRATGNGEEWQELCRTCDLMSGQENLHSDANHPGAFEDCPTCRADCGPDWNEKYKF